MPWTPAFHTRQPEDPEVFHDDSACPAGQAIAIGNGRLRCAVCSTLRAERQPFPSAAEGRAGSPVTSALGGGPETTAPRP
jgi:hypothetical protein